VERAGWSAKISVTVTTGHPSQGQCIRLPSKSIAVTAATEVKEEKSDDDAGM